MKTVLLVVVATIVLAGCASFAPVRMLPTGEWSIMDADNTRRRARLIITPVALPHQIAYSPTERCFYRVVSIGYAGRTASFEREVAVRTVHDRYLITHRQSGIASTALIGKDGRLFDFNTVQFDGSRTNSETFPAYASAQSRALREQPHVFAHFINELKIAYPHYATERRQVGSVVATVTDENGRPWAQYVYRGLTNNNGVTAAVLDLTKVREGDAGGGFVIGFNVVDLSRALPVLYVVDTGSATKLVVERTQCQ